MSVRKRILIPMIVTAVLVAAAILTSNTIQFSNYVDADVEVVLTEAVNEMVNEIKMMETMSYISALYFANDRELAEAMENGDREAIFNRAKMHYKETGAELCVIIDEKGIALARINAPELIGDSCLGMPCVESALSGRALTEIERGVTVGISTNTGMPVYGADGLLLGAVVIGYRLDTDEFVDKLKSVSGCEHTVFMDDVRIATTLRNDDGSRAVGTPAPDSVSEMVSAGVNVSGQYKVLGREMLVKYIPLQSESGQIQGMLFAGQFLTEKIETVRAFIATGSLITVIILGLGVLLILVVAKRVSSPIVKMLDKVYFDALTGIRNRRFFDESIERLIATESRSDGTLSLMMIDIDNFKKYNDTYGHNNGDACLIMVAKALDECTTRADDFVSRYGGEEFVVVLPNTDENGARTIADKLLETVRKLNIKHEKNGAEGRVTISIGVTTGIVSYTHSGDDYVKKADEMLYFSKEAGRNRCSFSAFETDDDK